MSTQIKPSVTNPTIADIYQAINAEKLVLTPDFQRKFVWTTEHQEAFLETILKGLPFPEIYVCEGSIDVNKLTTTKLVIDGQQRLTTIRRYIEGDPGTQLTTIKAYAELSVDEKEQFLSYQVVVRDIGRVDDATVREIFRRINLTKFKLEDVEIHNAVYDGEFIQAAKRVLDNAPLEQYGVFKESEFTRMADLHFIMLVMSTIEHGGYFAQDREVEPNVAGFNERYPNRDHIIPLLLKTFAVINDLMLPADSIWFRKSNFFTLVVELAEHLDRLPPDLDAQLSRLEENIIQNKGKLDNEFGQYYSYMYQATHGRKARVVRGNLFQKHVLRVPTNELDLNPF
jgi:hypothetical protein